MYIVSYTYLYKITFAFNHCARKNRKIPAHVNKYREPKNVPERPYVASIKTAQIIIS